MSQRNLKEALELIAWLKDSQLPLTADVLRNSARSLRRQAALLDACADQLDKAIREPARS